MSNSIFKSPIVIGVALASITYLYLWYVAEQQYKENPSVPKRKIGLVTPGVIGVLTWFVVSSYFDFSSNTDSNINLNTNSNINTVKLPEVTPEYKLVTGGEGFNVKPVESSDSYHLIGQKMVKLPKTDVFIDLAAF